VPKPAEPSARRWSGYVCPDCRFIFRVPRDHDGKGIVCPSCRRLLKLPAEGEVLPPLVSAVQETDSESSPQPTTSPTTRARRRKERATPEWEQDSRSSKGSKSDYRLVWIGAPILVLLSVVAIYAVTRKTPVAPVAADPTPVATPASTPATAAVIPPITPEAPTFDFAAFRQVAEPMAKSFLQATDVSEILPLIHNPKRAEPRVRKHWADGKIPPQSFISVDADMDFSADGNIAGVNILLGEFNERRMVFLKSSEGWKIDWEFWMNWSDMSWSEFRSTKPTEPVVFRVTLNDVPYYNFHFTDDKKWQSFRLTSPDGEHSIYAYAERNTEEERRLRIRASKKNVPVMLALRFPEDGARDQVIIDRIIAEGWIEPEATDPP
jgi:DNA-directed RNA polymerase subunit RPC12/RpoP